MSVRIVLADDHGIVRDGLRKSLEEHPDLEVVGEARDGQEAVKLALDRGVDLVIMDLSMPGMNGIEATRRITQEAPTVKVLCLSMHSIRQFVTAALDAGASGYLLKERCLVELIGAVRAVMEGRVYLCPATSSTVAPADEDSRRERGTPPLAILTMREREVLQLVAEGHTNKEIAARLHLSEKTVSTHRQRIMDKLGIHKAAGLTRYAIEHGLTLVLPPPS